MRMGELTEDVVQRGYSEVAYFKGAETIVDALALG